MATITVTPGHTYGSTDTVTSTNLNDLGDPSVALDAGTIVDADISVSANIAGSKLAGDALAAAYPVGSIYMNASNSTNPATLLGFGTWVAFGAGRVLVGIDGNQSEFNSPGETGGAKTHTLSIGEMPSHDHVPNRNTYGTHNLLLRRNSNGAGSIGDLDSTVGEPDLTAGGVALPEAEGGGQAHNNLQPYIVVYMWRRTA